MTNAEVKRIGLEYRLAFRGPAWHGPSLKEMLDGVTAKAAAAKPVPGAHSIWEIVLHFSGWEDVVRRRLAGEALDLEGDDDWPPVPEVSEEAWSEALKKMSDRHDALRAAIRALNDEDLEKIAPGKNYTNYVMLHGVVQHNLYHGGQIALLKRALSGAG